MVRIFLTGYMGAGKTTLGKAFARYMNIPFIDLDWYIEERFHKTVGELFIERGETGFRELERNMLHEVAEFENVVILQGKEDEELKAFIIQALEKRAPFYHQAQYIFNADELEDRWQIETSVQCLRQLLGL